MRPLLVAAAFGLAMLGAVPAALELAGLPDAPAVDAAAWPPTGALDVPPLDRPAELAPAIEAPLELPADVAAPPRWSLDPRDVELPPPEAVAATAAGGILALAGLALYSRLSRGQLLDHERRDEVYKLIQSQPGISLSDIASACGLGWGTTVYHLQRLERASFVTSERNGARRCYFPVGTVPKDARVPLGALRQETTRSVASYVVERPGATQGELADALGITASAASKQVSKLESHGLVRRERDWKTVRLHPEPRLAELLA